MYLLRFLQSLRTTLFSSRLLCAAKNTRNVHYKGLGMNLTEVVSKLNEFAPLSLAEKWDNVGLLVEPSGRHHVKSLLLTNDLTDPVLQEAIKKQVNLVISYHPPIFVPLKRLTSASFKERIIVKAIEQRIAVYSPHTAFDAVHGGVNDWLASGLGKGEVVPLKLAECCEANYKVVISGCPLSSDLPLGKQELEKLQSDLNERSGLDPAANLEFSDEESESAKWSLQVSCRDGALPDVLQIIRKHSPILLMKTDVYKLAKQPIEGAGQGRLCTLESPVPLSDLVDRIKTHLNINHLRLALCQLQHETSTSKMNQPVQTIALCAGSGASVLKGVSADTYLTGEMSHHDVLEAVSRGIHVILCEHSNTERGFLKVFQEKLKSCLEDKVEVFVSTSDSDPLQVV